MNVDLQGFYIVKSFICENLRPIFLRGGAQGNLPSPHPPHKYS